MENARKSPVHAKLPIDHEARPSAMNPSTFFACGDKIAVPAITTKHEGSKSDENGCGDTLGAKFATLGEQLSPNRSYDFYESSSVQHGDYQPNYSETLPNMDAIQITCPTDESMDVQLDFSPESVASFLRLIDDCFEESPVSLSKDDLSFKSVNDWSTEVDDYNQYEKFQHLSLGVANSPETGPDSSFEFDDPNIRRALFDDNEQKVSIDNKDEEVPPNIVRIRYTRDYLMKFADCILAHAFPEGLRMFTASGELPLKQLENTVTDAEPLRRPYIPNMFGGMEHILFYNDVHYISHSKRSLVKF